MVDRILLLHTIVLALAGVPAIYINSLMGTTNDLDAYEADGNRRSINRGRVELSDVPHPDDGTWQGRIFGGLIERAALRRAHAAFHPDGAQELRDLDGVLAIDRTAPDEAESVSVLCNMTADDQTIAITGSATCLRSGVEYVEQVALPPYGSAWLSG